MKWWKKALILSGVWVVLTLGAALVHINVVLAGEITPQQDEKISESNGRLCGGGLMGTWVLTYLLRNKGKPQMNAGQRRPGRGF